MDGDSIVVLDVVRAMDVWSYGSKIDKENYSEQK